MMQLEEAQERVSNRRMPELEETQRLLRQAEQLLGGPMVTYWDSASGRIDDEDVEALRALLWDVPPTDRLFLCLTSTGGNGLTSLRVAHFIRQRCKHLTVLVPTNAASAATMLALLLQPMKFSFHLWPLCLPLMVLLSTHCLR